MKNFFKKRLILFFAISILLILSFFILPIKTTYADVKEVYLGGIPAGFSLEVKGAYVAGLSDVLTKTGIESPAKQAGIEVGDIILSIDGNEVNNAFDIEKSIEDGKQKKLNIKRGKNIFDLSIIPSLDLNDKPKLGLFIRDAINGIGTITYFTNNSYASLGHPVLDNDGNLLEIKQGEIFDCSINGYNRGERGNPGELKGSVNKQIVIGNVERNTITGVYGKINDNYNLKNKTKISLSNAQVGNAYIYTTIDGSTPKLYSIEIVKAENENQTIKNYVIKITDNRLLETTGGIVQGMSGSPIIQNGKLVGAVTHVFINDPTRGFGISIYNMLNN